MLLLLDNRDSFTYNVAAAFAKLGHPPRLVDREAMSVDELLALSPDYVVVGPGPGGPADVLSSGELLWRAARSSIPALGICLGHQSLALFGGGQVGRAPYPCHGKCSALLHDGQGLFSSLPQGVEVARYHSLAVQEDSLPKELICSARTTDGVVMALRHGTLPLSGVQFHPESVATGVAGLIMLQNWLSTGSSPS